MDFVPLALSAQSLTMAEVIELSSSRNTKIRITFFKVYHKVQAETHYIAIAFTFSAKLACCLATVMNGFWVRTSIASDTLFRAFM